jgi:hypothetical protein
MPMEKIGSAANETIAIILKGSVSQVKKKKA